VKLELRIDLEGTVNNYQARSLGVHETRLILIS